MKGTYFGYTVPVLVNAKNSYGGYTGFKVYKFFFQRGEILVAWKKTIPGGFADWKIIQLRDKMQNKSHAPAPLHV
jgi:hypothetical protein